MDPEQTAIVPPAGATAVAGERIFTSKEHPSEEPPSDPSSDGELSCERQSSTTQAPSGEVPSSETPSEPLAKEHTYKFGVNMSCGGCSGAVARALTKAQEEKAGISSFDISLEKKEVIVKGSISFEALEERIKKTGKTVRSGETVE